VTFTIDSQPDIERGLLVRAQARGVSLVDFAQEVLAREVLPVEPSSAPETTAEGRVSTALEPCFN